MGGPCIECGERADVTEDLTVELAKDAMDFLYEHPATLRRLAKRDYRPQDNGRSVHVLCFGTYAARMEEALAARSRRSADRPNPLGQ